MNNILHSFDHVRECPCRCGNDCISKCICFDKVRKWRMEYEGFAPFAIIATTPGKARFAAYRAAKESGYARDFRDFSARIRSFRRMEWTDQP